MTRFAIFQIERKDGKTEVITMKVECGLGVLGPGSIPRSESLNTLHQAVLDEDADRVKVHSLIFADVLTEHSEIELHRPEAR
jgi:hypothetical protein